MTGLIKVLTSLYSFVKKNNCLKPDQGGKYDTVKRDELVVLGEKRRGSLPGAAINI
jgi:predicted Rdx family selenoprotein